MVSGCAGRISRWFKLLSLASSLSGKEVRFPHPFISRYLCNTMDAMEIVQILGFFGPLPTRLLNSSISLDEDLPAPLSCILLTQDKLVSPGAQRRTAERLRADDIIEIDTCHMGVWQRPRAVADALLKYA